MLGAHALFSDASGPGQRHQTLGQTALSLQHGHWARTTWYYGGVATGPAGRDNAWRNDMELNWMPVLQT